MTLWRFCNKIIQYFRQIYSKYTLFMCITIVWVSLAWVIVDRMYVLTLLKHKKARSADVAEEGWLCTNLASLTASERSARTTSLSLSRTCASSETFLGLQSFSFISCPGCASSGVSRVFFWLPGNPPSQYFFNQGVDTIQAPTFNSHLNLRVLENPPPLRPTLDTPLAS